MMVLYIWEIGTMETNKEKEWVEEKKNGAYIFCCYEEEGEEEEEVEEEIWCFLSCC